jgi:hypothetical protein
MKEILVEEEDPDPCKRDLSKVRLSGEDERYLRIFRETVEMFDGFKRVLLRKKLKKEKLRILTEYLRVCKQLKILDELDRKAKEERGKDS